MPERLDNRQGSRLGFKGFVLLFLGPVPFHNTGVIPLLFLRVSQCETCSHHPNWPSLFKCWVDAPILTWFFFPFFLFSFSSFLSHCEECLAGEGCTQDFCSHRKVILVPLCVWQIGTFEAATSTWPCGRPPSMSPSPTYVALPPPTFMRLKGPLPAMVAAPACPWAVRCPWTFSPSLPIFPIGYKPTYSGLHLMGWEKPTP